VSRGIAVNAEIFVPFLCASAWYQLCIDGEN